MRRGAVVAVVLVAAAAVGVLLTRRGGDNGSSERSTTAIHAVAAEDQSAAPAPSTDLDVEAARSAAVRAVSSTDEVVRAGFISRRELIESFTTPSYGPTLAGVTSEDVNAMLFELGERDADTSRLAVVEQPVTATAEPTADGVRVRVWSVLVIAVPGVGPGRQVWRTVTLDMVDSGDRWLVDGWTSSSGPSPAPAAEGVFDDASAFVEPLAWPAATEAASIEAG